MITTVREVGIQSVALRLRYEAERRSGLLERRMRKREGWDSWSPARILSPEYRRPWPSLATESHATLFSQDRLAMIMPVLTKVLGEDGIHVIVSRAERVLKGEFQFFGKSWVNAELPPDWHSSPVTGARVEPSAIWTKMGFHGPSYGDLKFILEPSRFLFVYDLIRAYCLTKDDRYPQAFWRVVESWAESNPPATGPLWICGQESALRIVAWSLGWSAFRNAKCTTEHRATTLMSLIAAHAWRIEQTGAYALSQRSNHAISEAVGLLVASLTFPEFIGSPVWKKAGLKHLEKAALDQFLLDGTYAQQSLNYQRMSLQMVALAAAVLRLDGLALSSQVMARLSAAHKFLFSVMDPENGRVPNCGANDGSLPLPLDSLAYHDFRPTIQLLASLCGSESELPSGPWDEPAIWLFGHSSEHAAKHERDLGQSNSFPGYYLIRDQDSWAMLRCEDGSRRPFHADQLHLELWRKGINLARDAGTYLYNGEEPWNNGLACTAVHNTVTVGSTDQMERAGRFLWRKWSHGHLLEHGAHILRAEHDGYARTGVIHRRTVIELAGRGWAVVDDLIGHGQHDFSLHWLLASAAWNVVQSEPFTLQLEMLQEKIRVLCVASGGDQPYLVRGGHTVWPATSLSHASPFTHLRGWVSPTYGALQPTLAMVCDAIALAPFRYCTVFLFDPLPETKIDINAHLNFSWRDRRLLIKIPPVGQHGTPELHREYVNHMPETAR